MKKHWIETIQCSIANKVHACCSGVVATTYKLLPIADMTGIKKRAIAKMLGSFDKRTCIFADDLIDNLNQKEKIEVMLNVENLRHLQMMHLTQCQMKMSNTFIKELADLYHSMFIETEERQSCFRIKSSQATVLVPDIEHGMFVNKLSNDAQPSRA